MPKKKVVEEAVEPQAEAEAEHLADMRLIFEEEDLLRRRELERRERREAKETISKREASISVLQDARIRFQEE